MRKYLGIVSIITLISTTLVIQFFVAGKVSSPADIIILLTGAGLTIFTALFSEKGQLKTILLSLYGLLIIGFLLISIIFGVAHM